MRQSGVLDLETLKVILVIFSIMLCVFLAKTEFYSGQEDKITYQEHFGL